MKATILLGTLKKTEMSNTEVLAEFFKEHIEKENVACSIIKLVEHKILPGTYSNMGEDDEWPQILNQLISSDIIIFATPIWWNNQSSEIQRVIERLDELHDEILKGGKSKMKGKAGGVIITGDSDGAQSVISNIANFYNAIGIILPPFATLSVLWENQAKNKKPTKEELMKKYSQDYKETAEKMAKQLVSYAGFNQQIN